MWKSWGFTASSHAYLREKSQDVQDLMLRLLSNLTEQNENLPLLRGKIIIASEIFPSDMVMLASEEVLAIILASGGTTSHIAILARSLDIPMIIADHPDLMKLNDDTTLLLDADIGNIYIAPSEEVVTQFTLKEQTQQEVGDAKMQPETITADGTKITLQSNINLLSELPLARSLKSEGIGLYRTEFPFLIRNTMPSEEEQFVIYSRLADEMSEYEITMRTLDVGGDKGLSYFEPDCSDNPALGLRSIRFSLQHEDIFRQQLRSMLRAAADLADFRIMFPMISSLAEFNDARNIVLSCIQELRAKGIAHHAKPKIGIMIEVPAVVEIMDELSIDADFFCIGTNDFIQYLLGVDRTNQKMSEYYRPNHPSVLRTLKRVVDSAIRNNREISICGEMAHEMEFIPFLIGIGLR